jgi:hypothetical protein
LTNSVLAKANIMVVTVGSSDQKWSPSILIHVVKTYWKSKWGEKSWEVYLTNAKIKKIPA